MKPIDATLKRRQFLNSTLRFGVGAFASLGFGGAASAQTAPPVQQPTLSGHWRDRYLTIPGGTPAPAEGFYGTNNQWLTLQQFYGRPALIVFWATWCSACQIDMPLLNATAQAIDPNRLTLLTISIDERPMSDVGGFMQSKGWYNLPLLQDQTQQLFQVFGSGATPTAFLMDRYGRILGGLRGAAYWDRQASRDVIDFMQTI